jgi:DNA-directed RNA polymerase sigma subunit (sigma70/sigma32)
MEPDMVVNGENKQLDLAWEDFSSEEYCKTGCEFNNTCNADRETCLKKAFADLLDTLGEKEQAVLKLRFGFCGDKPYTCDEIANLLALEPIEVRYVCGKAIRKLRHPSRRKVILNRKSDFLSAQVDSYKRLIAEVFDQG